MKLTSVWYNKEFPLLKTSALLHLYTHTYEKKVTQSCLTLCDYWTAACPTPLSVEFSRQEYWSGLPFPSPGDLPDSGMKLRSSALQADSLPPEPQGKPI